MCISVILYVMNLQESESLFAADPPPPRYEWHEVAMIIYCSLTQVACTLFGLGVVVSEAVPGDWEQLQGHTRLFRIVSSVLGVVVILAPVLGIILRGPRGWIACLGSCYLLLFVSWMMLPGGGYMFAACMSVAISAAIAMMQQGALQRFFGIPCTGIKQHLIAAGCALTVVGLFGLSLLLRSR